MHDVRRGDIVLVAGGVYARKPRPAVVIQDDLFSATGSVTVCPFTTATVDAPLLRMAVFANEDSGINADSFIMIDKITSVKRENLGDVVGHLTAVQILELERRIVVFLGLAH